MNSVPDTSEPYQLRSQRSTAKPVRQTGELLHVQQQNTSGTCQHLCRRRVRLVRHYYGVARPVVRTGGHHLLHSSIPNWPGVELALHDDPKGATCCDDVGALVAGTTNSLYTPTIAEKDPSAIRLELGGRHAGDVARTLSTRIGKARPLLLPDGFLDEDVQHRCVRYTSPPAKLLELRDRRLPRWVLVAASPRVAHLVEPPEVVWLQNGYEVRLNKSVHLDVPFCFLSYPVRVEANKTCLLTRQGGRMPRDRSTKGNEYIGVGGDEGLPECSCG